MHAYEQSLRFLAVASPIRELTLISRLLDAQLVDTLSVPWELQDEVVFNSRSGKLGVSLPPLCGDLWFE
jgi:hypothetical protein